MTEYNLTTNKKSLIRNYVNVHIEYLKYLNSFASLKMSKSYLEIAPLLDEIKENIITKLSDEDLFINGEILKMIIDYHLKEELQEFIGIARQEHLSIFDKLSLSLTIRDFISRISSEEMNNKDISSIIASISSLTLSSSFNHPRVWDNEYFRALRVKYDENSNTGLYLYQALSLLQYLDHQLTKHLNDQTSVSNNINVLLRELTMFDAITSIDLLVNVLDNIEERVALIKPNKKYKLVDTSKN